MRTKPSCQLQVAVPAPLRQVFDYLYDQSLQPGIRVLVPFGRRKLIGIVVSSHSSSTKRKLKPIEQVLDDAPVFTEKMMRLLTWSASYYHHPIGETLHAALPGYLRQNNSLKDPGTVTVYQRVQGVSEDLQNAKLKRAPKQARLYNLIPLDSWVTLDHIRAAGNGVETSSIKNCLSALIEKQIVISKQQTVQASQITGIPFKNNLNPEQQHAVDAISRTFDCFTTTVVYGITGSGKTEVYLHAVEHCLSKGKQALVLVPEIALTPQLLSRFEARLGGAVFVMHSNMTERQRYRSWWAGHHGQANVILGTRSSVFTRFDNLGLIVIDEEHDTSFKQFDGFRYHARDIAIKRASLEDIPIVLGSATPSVETMHNANSQKYQLCRLTNRATGAALPTVELVDLKLNPHKDGLTPQLIDALKNQLKSKKQSILFINRRGFAPVAQCSCCGWQAKCMRCDAFMTVHHHVSAFRCHHCGRQQTAQTDCPECSEDLFFSGVGTQRVETALHKILPEARIIRFDRDEITTLKKLEKVIDKIKLAEVDIIIGTQLIAKGHDFANVTLVGVINSDQGLYSSDFRAPEFLIQQIIQVAGRAGRSTAPGRVIIQTAHPENPYLQLVKKHNHENLYDICRSERELLRLPPFGYLALWRAESTNKNAALNFLGKVHQKSKLLIGGQFQNSIEVLDPVKSPMEKLAGRFRAQLLVKANHRSSLHQFTQLLVSEFQSSRISRTVRWSVDIDPMEMY